LNQHQTLLRKTGYFDKVDKLYGDIGGTEEETIEGGDEGDMGGDDFGSSGGGGGFGGDFGGEDTGGGDFGGDEGDFGGEDTGGGDFGEGVNTGVIDKLLNEGKSKNEDIKMLFDGVNDLIKQTEEQFNIDDDEENGVLED